MESVDAADFLQDQWPRHLWPLVPTTLRQAYKAASDLADTDPILQVESARDNHGRLISWATDLAFKRLMDTDQLPFDYRWHSFTQPTGRYLEIRLSHSVATISQVADPAKQPRNVRFRENGRMNNEPFFDLPEFDDEHSVRGLPHLLIVHGYQELAFSHLAIPHPLHRRDYRYRTPNLMHLPHEVPGVGPAVEDTDTDFDATNLLKEEIKRWRRDHGSE